MAVKEEKKTGQSSAGFVSAYDGAVKESYEKLRSRPAFKYEAASDPNYRALRDTYRREGSLAMKNTMAEAADLTGGYGSSYAQRLGQQQYGEYLRKLSEQMPELYSQAYNRYLNETDALSERLNTASGLAAAEYERYIDGENLKNEKEQFGYKKQQDAYKNLADIIMATGYVPNEAELSQSGMSKEQAYALGYEFMRINGLLPAEEQNAWVNYYNLSPTSPFDIGYSDAAFKNREQLKLAAN